jgi:hypothetical protein
VANDGEKKEKDFSRRALRPQSSERKTAGPDIGTYDTCARPGSSREFLKMRQWFEVADEVR